MGRKKKNAVFGLILAGGSSSRLFPFNKVLSDFTGSGKSLIQQAYERLELPAQRIFVLTASDMLAPISRQLRVPRQNIFVDPARRGTWPAILWAMAHLRQQDPEALIALVTGDPVIQGKGAFRKSMHGALAVARDHRAFVMIGIAPSQNASDWRSFGVFRSDAQGRVTDFEEKPSLERAQEMMKDGHYLWNSGMFFFRISTAEEALARFQPDMFRVYQAMAAAIASGKKDEAAFLFQDFPEKVTHPLDPTRYVDNSIDYAIMTPLVSRQGSGLEARAVQAARFQWTDLGQWDALRQVIKPDRAGNIRLGSVSLKRGVRHCILVAEKAHRVQVGDVEGLVIAFARNTALVVSIEQLSRMKEIVQEALKHPDRIVIEQDVTECEMEVSEGRLLAIGLSGLRIQLQKKQLFVSCKPGFIQ